MRNYFPKRRYGAPLHTLSNVYGVPVCFVHPTPYFEVVYCFTSICRRQRVAVARCRMVCLDLIGRFQFIHVLVSMCTKG